MRGLVALGAGAALLLGGCSGADRPQPVEDATTLDQNIPTDVDGHQVIAFNMDDDSGVVSVDGDRDEVTVGDTVTVGSVTYEVVQVVPDSGDDDGPDGWISIREQ